LIESCDWL